MSGPLSAISPEPKSSQILYAEQRASALWAIPTVRQLVIEHVDGRTRREMSTLDRATFETYIEVIYRRMHIEDYKRFLSCLIPRDRLERYNQAIRIIDIAGTLAKKQDVLDCYAFFDILPNLRQVEWTDGHLSAETRQLEEDQELRFRCTLPVTWNDTGPSPGTEIESRLQYTPRRPTHFGYTLRYEPDADVQVYTSDMLSRAFAPFGTEPPYTPIYGIDITVYQSLGDLMPALRSCDLGQRNGLRSIHLDADMVELNAVIELIGMLPSPCTELSYNSDNGDEELEDLLQIFHGCFKDSSLQHVSLHAYHGTGDPWEDHHFGTIRSWDERGRSTMTDMEERLIAFVSAQDLDISVHLTPTRLQTLDIQLYLGDSWSSFIASKCSLPPASTTALHLLAIGGPYCRYTFKVTDEKEGQGTIGHMYTIAVRQEIALILERQRRAEGPGWRQQEKPRKADGMSSG